MKHSMVRKIEAEEVIEVTDLESLDFMVVIQGSLRLDYEQEEGSATPSRVIGRKGTAGDSQTP